TNGERPCNRRHTNERNELAPFQLIELHSDPSQARIGEYRKPTSTPTTRPARGSEPGAKPSPTEGHHHCHSCSFPIVVLEKPSPDAVCRRKKQRCSRSWNKGSARLRRVHWSKEASRLGFVFPCWFSPERIMLI